MPEGSASSEQPEPEYTTEMPQATAESLPVAPEPAPAASPIENLESALAEALVEAVEPPASPAAAESAQSPVIEPISEAQIEPLNEVEVEPEKPSEPERKPAPEPRSDGRPSTQIDTSPDAARSKLVTARARRTSIKQERMTRILVRLAEVGSMTNDDVQKLLKVSDATATRYCAGLARQGLIRKTGRGRGVVYTLP